MPDNSFELMLESVKDAADPLDYLSLHPLPQTKKDNMDNVIKITMTIDNETVALNCICNRMHTGLQPIYFFTWKDKDIDPFYSTCHEL